MLNGAPLHLRRVPSSRPKTYTLHRQGARLVVRQRSRICNSTKLGAGPTRFNSHRLDHLHGQALSQHRPCHPQVANQTGSLRLRLVGHQVHLIQSLGKRTVAAVQTVLSVQPMSWKCSTTRHGEKVSEEVSHKRDGANHTHKKGHGVHSDKWEFKGKGGFCSCTMCSRCSTMTIYKGGGGWKTTPTNSAFE